VKYDTEERKLIFSEGEIQILQMVTVQVRVEAKRGQRLHVCFYLVDPAIPNVSVPPLSSEELGSLRKEENLLKRAKEAGKSGAELVTREEEEKGNEKNEEEQKEDKEITKKVSQKRDLSPADHQGQKKKKKIGSGN